MAVGMIANLKIQAGKNAEFEQIFLELQNAVLANEPGVNFYSCHRSDDPNVYVVLEQYADEAAFAAHGKTDHMKTIGAKMGAVLAGRPELKKLESIA